MICSDPISQCCDSLQKSQTQIQATTDNGREVGSRPEPCLDDCGMFAQLGPVHLRDGDAPTLLPSPIFNNAPIHSTRELQLVFCGREASIKHPSEKLEIA